MMSTLRRPDAARLDGRVQDRERDSLPHPNPGALTAPATIALFMRNLADGGAEHVMLTLARGFRHRGYVVDLVVVRADGALLSRVPTGVRLIELATGRVVRSIPVLARYLRKERPEMLLSTLNTANAVSVLAAQLAGGTTRVVIRQADHLTRSLKERSTTTRTLIQALVRSSYTRASAIVAVSSGVADDLANRLKISRSRIHVIPNPIVTAELRDLAGRPVDHQWFVQPGPPVILGVGRLATQKRFDVLIRAVARVRQQRDVRLVILGEGEERPGLERLVRELGMTDVVSLPGFAPNPFGYMARASLFVLSSAWEGLPGVLIQALACGCPVVSTDCESGPREILQGGRLGRLVPVDDHEALAVGISSSLDEPRVAQVDRALAPYGESAVLDAYLDVLRPVHR